MMNTAPVQSRRPWVRRGRVIVASVCSAVALTSCNIVGPALMLAEGAKRIPGEFDLPVGQIGVVFIDNTEARIPERRLVTTAGAVATDEILNRTEVASMLDPNAAQLLTRRETFDEQLSIAEIGSRVGADFVIYVAPTNFTLQGDGATFTPRIGALIKVIDVQTGARLWPEDPEGREILVNYSKGQGLTPETTADMNAANVDLANTLGASIAQLFFKTDQLENVQRNR